MPNMMRGTIETLLIILIFHYDFFVLRNVSNDLFVFKIRKLGMQICSH